MGLASTDSTRHDHGLNPVDQGERAAVILWTNDTRTAYEYVTGALGSPRIKDPHIWLGRLLIAWTQDPEGHVIQIVQEIANQAAHP